MKTLGVIANCSKSRAPVVLAELEERAADVGLDLIADRDTSELMKSARPVSPAELFERADAVMALGGDGTMLKVVRDLADHDKPVIGVNIGALGFMTSVAEDELARAVECMAKDDYHVSHRAIAETAIVRDGHEVASYRALNEILVSRAGTSRVVMLDLSVDDNEVTCYHCDGLMISTPTGSTGYSMSAGGPIVMPGTNVFVISVICPHTLSVRPLVIPDSSRITVGLSRNVGPLAVAADGQTGQDLQQGDRLLIRKASKDVRFIHLPGHSYFDVLHQKLHWRGSAV